LSNPRDFSHALNQVCEQITSITGMESAVIYLMDDSKQFLDIVAHRGISDNLYQQMRRIGLDDPITRYIAVEGNTFATDDLSTYEGDGIAGPRSEGYRAGIAVPLFMRDVPVGIIEAGSQVHTKYDEADIALLVTIGRQIGKALENAELYNKMQQRMRELEGIAKLGAACSGNFNTTELANLAVEWMQKLVSADFTMVRLVENNQMRLVAHRAARPIDLAPSLPVNDVFGPVINQFAQINLFDVAQADLPSEHRLKFLDIGIRAILIVPMLARDHAIGALAVAHGQPRIWQTNEIELAQTIANQVAGAIDSAQLFQNVLAEQRKVQAIFDSGLSGLFATDAEGRIEMFNQAAERITQWNRHEVLHRKWEDVFGDPSQIGTTPLIYEALRHKKTVFVQEGRSLLTHDGRVIPVAKAVAPLFDDKGEVVGAVGAFWDLSREKASELQREMFLNKVAHEINTPLTTVLTALQILNRKKVSEEGRIEALAVMEHASERLRRFAADFLDLEAGFKSQRPVHLEPLLIQKLIHDFVKEYRLAHPNRKILVRATSKNLIVRADLMHIETVLRNLLDNAVHHSPDRSVIQVTIKPYGDDQVDIAVHDQGSGIPLADQEKIFTPFYRSAQLTERHVYGHGLGLALAKQSVEQMGGQIWVDSQPDQGSTFHFTLRRYR
jgi:PAS domain S-box-containing protein